MDTWVGTAQEPENANSESSGGKVMAELEYELPQEPVGMSKGQIACHAERAPAGGNSGNYHLDIVESDERYR